MMIVPAGVKVHLALGHTDMRKGLDGLAMLVQATLKQDPFSGHLFAFRGKVAGTYAHAEAAGLRPVSCRGSPQDWRPGVGTATFRTRQMSAREAA
ncbi:IS66 family insertion sequence element accessory protein TnpB [Aminobacter sp. LjRoot7]|uniref:IS66 family insertion sequence element accessory protein TnpB n=1 Tax=Aminobacter sp. LjRoot7 TaxID=3342335 RepID=UPI003ECD7D42